MDRQEAMLRELKLYPLWVRRNEYVQTMQSAVPVQPAMPVQLDMSVQPAVPAQSEMMPEPKAIVAEHQEKGEPEPLSIFDVQAAPKMVANGSLREFQLQNQGGVLGSVNWPELREKVKSCELCKLRAGCANTVFGSGDEHANWLFIGEAPGAEEDATGEPFMGLSGRLLDNMLLAIRLKRKEIYISNVIKCRPPEDRHPHAGEVTACLPYLKRQIDMLKPKLIVVLGKTAAAALLQTDATIASLRGTLHNYNGIPLVVTFHPAYLLRSPMEKAKVWQDLCFATDEMKRLQSN